MDVRTHALGLVYSIYTFGSSYTDSGLFSVYAATDSTKLDKLVRAITREIKKLQDTVSAEELSRAKSKLESEILMSRESTVSKSEAAGYYLAHYDRYVEKEELIEKIRSVQLNDISDAGNFLLQNRENITLAAIGKVETLMHREEISSLLT